MEIHENSEDIKVKLNKCLDSLQRYPLVIHNVEHCLLLRHFDNATVNKMKHWSRLVKYSVIETRIEILQR